MSRCKPGMVVELESASRSKPGAVSGAMKACHGVNLQQLEKGRRRGSAGASGSLPLVPVPGRSGGNGVPR